MGEPMVQFTPTVVRYEALMDVVRQRMTPRQFDPAVPVPREHIEMVLEAARHAPSGAMAILSRAAGA